jgi:hypothetical protein
LVAGIYQYGRTPFDQCTELTLTPGIFGKGIVALRQVQVPRGTYGYSQYPVFLIDFNRQSVLIKNIVNKEKKV